MASTIIQLHYLAVVFFSEATKAHTTKQSILKYTFAWCMLFFWLWYKSKTGNCVFFFKTKFEFGLLILILLKIILKYCDYMVACVGKHLQNPGIHRISTETIFSSYASLLSADSKTHITYFIRLFHSFYERNFDLYIISMITIYIWYNYLWYMGRSSKYTTIYTWDVPSPNCAFRWGDFPPPSTCPVGKRQLTGNDPPKQPQKIPLRCN